MSSISFSPSSPLTDSELLKEVRAKLSAVELALMSFTVPGAEEERRERLRERLEENQWLPLYLEMEKHQLQEREHQLLEEKLLLLRKEEREGECLCLPLGVWLRAGCCSAEKGKGGGIAGRTAGRIKRCGQTG
jgi:hypothetical protein